MDNGAVVRLGKHFNKFADLFNKFASLFNKFAP